MSSGKGANLYAPQQFYEHNVVYEGNAIACILIGVYFVVAGMNLYLLQRRKTHNILLLFTAVQLAVVVLYMMMVLYTSPGRALSAFGIVDPESTMVAPGSMSTWPAIVADIAIVFNTCISDAFLLYRCYHVVRLQNKYLLSFPVLLYLATVGSSLAWLVVNSNPGLTYPNPPIYVAGIFYLSTTAAMNICASSLIVMELWTYRRAICKVMGSQRGTFYLSYIAMTLESALLYTVFTIIALIVFALKNPLEFVFMSVWTVMEVISPSLIVYRIACGISFEAEEDGSIIVGSIRFSSSSDHPLTSVPGTRYVHQDVDGPDTTLISSFGDRGSQSSLGMNV